MHVNSHALIYTDFFPPCAALEHPPHIPLCASALSALPLFSAEVTEAPRAAEK